ncbi:MAG TPA: hypothetical protein PLL26_04205 [Candidatus Dojkabacteria bacterium]|jgi:hypothetical protein|nr:hypothetical protein [Candidatus Dojkabacteria bacterium]
MTLVDTVKKIDVLALRNEAFTIIFKGDWLKEWGFNSGDNLNIIYEGSERLTF